MRDMCNNILVKRVLSPVSVSDNTAQVGQIIDRSGYDALAYVINIGSVADADATFAVLLEESDASDMTGAAAVADADMISQTSGTAPETAASFQFDSDNQVRKLGYIGSKRYTRLTITPASNASAALMSAVAVLGHPHSAPVTQATS
ncbi:MULTISPECIES: hypothetical protein [Methylosinus]|uniref:Uncharacterized protein n=1 Tax=Methylosinus trichosporium (strain ATCC 35070 / NCIMB 11131 / UNIQEM 75 / OB3b) TaxID=595536 RepID=A0A2D2CXF2_METT3|nr:MULTISPECIES: hypothetical protein [Methylosinus]ATQ67415.1 hypothetical protein CQW49_05535 [Methylosinus trichosporium OB3b]OBS51574.1 hypothetical protein A8B73_15260 [Methylosinus sp. 3S-1]